MFTLFDMFFYPTSIIYILLLLWSRSDARDDVKNAEHRINNLVRINQEREGRIWLKKQKKGKYLLQVDDIKSSPHTTKVYEASWYINSAGCLVLNTAVDNADVDISSARWVDAMCSFRGEYKLNVDTKNIVSKRWIEE